MELNWLKFIEFWNLENLTGWRLILILIPNKKKKRKNAVNSFENQFFKLINNSVYGKTIENLRKRINVTLVNDVKPMLKKF